MSKTFKRGFALMFALSLVAAACGGDDDDDDAGGDDTTEDTGGTDSDIDYEGIGRAQLRE